MKAIRIDIKKELIETDRPYLRVAEFPHNLGTKILKEGEAPDYLANENIKEKVYRAMQVRNPETKKVTNYFVNTDDDGLFQELVEVSKGFIKKQSNKLLEKFKDNELPTIMADAKGEEMRKTVKIIKKLSWYKRLFNKF